MGYFEETLLDFARGQASTEEAHRVLKHRAQFSFRTNPAFVNWNEPLPADIRVPLRVSDIRAALSRYLDGEWSADQLRDWGEFLTMIGAYSLPEPPSTDEDYYDEAWDVIHELGAPVVYGPISRESALKQLDRLGRYDMDREAAT
jgi:hypothetical protein